MKKIAVLGSTGSIGCNTLKVARYLKEEVQVVALAAAGNNLELLIEQAKEFEPELIAVFREDAAIELRGHLQNVTILSGMEGLIAVATHSTSELVVSAITGNRGLQPTVAAIEAGKNIALANKEVLVAGGEYVMSLVKEKGVSLLPVDSEHSAIFQCLEGEMKENLRRIILTASGGPFRSSSHEELQKINVDQALAHPTWAMGPKVTIDSSTLMNKGLEVIEAHWLFGVPYEQVEVVVHPQSVIHSMVECCDGSILAQMGEPSMILPIQYAITYPKRLGGMMKPFDFSMARTLEFFPPDFDRFRCLKLAYEAGKEGGSFPCFMNAANEVLVERFLNRQFSWCEIATKLEELMCQHSRVSMRTLDSILEVDEQARLQANKI